MRFSSRTHRLSPPAALLLLAACVLIIGTNSRAKDPEQPVTQVHAADIPKRAQIIGYLGHPLGEIIEIRGEWRTHFFKGSFDELRLHVTDVNGRELDQPIEFDGDIEKVDGAANRGPIPGRAAGDIWEMRGLEIGDTWRVPGQAYAEASGPEGEWQVPGMRPGNVFRTRFCYVSLKRISAAPDHARAKNRRRHVARIHATLIPHEAQIIGYLGYPLGEIIDVRGQWDARPFNAKIEGPTFRVTHVNGRQLDEPVKFDVERIRKVHPSENRDPMPEPVAGDIWEMRGTEIGGQGLPGRVYREAYGLEGEGDSPVAQQYPFTFVTKFFYVSVKRIPAAPEQRTSK